MLNLSTGLTNPVFARAAVPASKVLVTVGTGCSMSAVGSTETHTALVTGNRQMIGFAAFDAGLVDIDLEKSTPNWAVFTLAAKAGTDHTGEVISVEEIESRWGARLREDMGIRFLAAPKMAAHVPTDIAALLPHDLEDGGLRQLSGTTFKEIRHSPFKDMFGLFDDDPRLAPSLQSQLFLYGGLGALAALPTPLASLLPGQAHRFRVAAACCFSGQEAFHALLEGMQKGAEKWDKVAYRLSSVLTTHGPALINSMLSPAFNLSKVKRNPEVLKQLLANADSVMRNVPQAPLVSNAACASAFLTFSDIAPNLLLSSYPGYHAPYLTLWTAADAAVSPDARILEGFGPGAMMSREKLAAMASGRSVSESLAPFDVDAQGTIVGNAGSGLIITTLEFALRHFLDITSIIVGWSQSGETGGKGHFAGVGFGGENALISALRMAHEAHGYGVGNFRHLLAHATGTHTNSVTDLNVAVAALEASKKEAGDTSRLHQLTVGAAKAVGDGHSMGETGLKAYLQGIRYLLGLPSVGIPSLKSLDPDLGAAAEHFYLSPDPVRGNEEGGFISAVQGFGGYVGAMAARSANRDSISRYELSDPALLAAYLERWEDIRRQRIIQEAKMRRTRGAVVQLADYHRWPAMVA